MATVKKKLPVLCPQEYHGMTMTLVVCTRCNMWNKPDNRCDVTMGIEEEPEVSAADIPNCPLELRCQHQLQKSPAPCIVRARGQLCESAVGEDHPLAFSASYY